MSFRSRSQRSSCRSSSDTDHGAASPVRGPARPGLLGTVFLACAASLMPLASTRAGGDCPDEQASDVAARTDDSGGDQCFIGIVLFGYQIGLAGPQCPAARYHYPAHQECQGRHHVGSRCAVTSLVAVRMESCTCVYFGTTRFGLGLPLCRCTDNGTAGSIQNAETLDCFPHTN